MLSCEADGEPCIGRSCGTASLADGWTCGSDEFAGSVSAWPLCPRVLGLWNAVGRVGDWAASLKTCSQEPGARASSASCDLSSLESAVLRDVRLLEFLSFHLEVLLGAGEAVDPADSGEGSMSS